MGFRQPLGVEIDQDEARTFPGEAQGAGPADAEPGAGYEGGAAVKAAWGVGGVCHVRKVRGMAALRAMRTRDLVAGRIITASVQARAPAPGETRCMIAIDNGFEEAVGLVADCEESARRLCSATGYAVRHRGPVPAGALALLGLPPQTQAHEVLVAHTDAVRGGIRLVALAGDPAPPMRDGGQAWDTGGIFDVNMRALTGIDELHGAFGRAGFISPAPVVDWDFGPLAVREVVEKDADGLCIALMERVHPPLTGYETIGGPSSWVFNSTQVVADFDAARAFFVDGLGWMPVQETHGPAGQGDGANCMGFPLGLAAQIDMRIGIYHPRGRMEGSVEIIAFGCGGRDFSAAAPPGRGWASLRLPVSDLDAMAARLGAAGCALGELVEFEWAPHGTVRAVCATTTWGARFELLERI